MNVAQTSSNQHVLNQVPLWFSTWLQATFSVHSNGYHNKATHWTAMLRIAWSWNFCSNNKSSCWEAIPLVCLLQWPWWPWRRVGVAHPQCVPQAVGPSDARRRSSGQHESSLISSPPCSHRKGQRSERRAQSEAGWGLRGKWVIGVKHWNRHF